MVSKFKGLAWLLLIGTLVSVTSSEEDNEPPRIGIIGAGVGGTTTAYYLRQLFGESAVIDVFEQDRVGGRARLIHIDGADYEAGGSVIHPLNEYMVNFAKLFGLEKKESAGGGLAFYGNDGVRMQTSAWKAVTMAKFLWRYGYDIARVDSWIQDAFLNNFSRIYKLQDAGIAFTTVEDMLRAMDEKFVYFTQMTLQELLKQHGFSDTFINEVVRGAVRTNYGQDVDMPAFVGAVSLAGVQPGLWAVKGGNKLIPERLLRSSKAKLITGKVSQILLQKDGGSVTYEVTYKNPEAKEDEENAREYDIVVIATPLTAGQTDIKFEEFSQSAPVPEMKMHDLVALFVQGVFNHSYLGFEKLEDMPDEIFTVETDIFFNSIGRKDPVINKEHLKKKENEDPVEVYKVFLNKVPTEKEVQLLFKSRKDLRLVNWKAYPHYSKNMELPPFVLYDRLYYVNGIETAASAFEMCAISGRNVALLAYNHWHGHLERIDEPNFELSSSDKKEEL